MNYRPDKKYHSKEITERFLQAMDNITGSNLQNKITAADFGEVVGINGSNLTRLRSFRGGHFVTLEAIGKLCKHYKISPAWLISGKGEMYFDETDKTPLQILKQAVAGIEKVIKQPVPKKLPTKIIKGHSAKKIKKKYVAIQ